MNIVAENYADTLRRSGPDSTPERDLLDAVGDDLRTAYDDAATALPAGLIALAARLDGGREHGATAA